jgi:GNAT superfamily N-acetyltransferase
VTSGKAHGAIAYDDGTPVGWISYERRQELPRLDRAPSLACDDAEQVWSIPCFFIKAPYRGRGVATALLKHALRALRGRGARVAEGYPVRPRASRTEIPPLFAFTGTVSMFEKAGFTAVGTKRTGKQRFRRTLRRAQPIRS